MHKSPNIRLPEPSKTPARFQDRAKLLLDLNFLRYHSIPLCLNGLIEGSLFQSGMDLKDCVALKIVVRKPSYSTLFNYLLIYFIYLFVFIQFDVSSLSGQNVILNGSQDLLYVSEKVNNIFLPPINTLVNVRLKTVSFQNGASHSLNSLWCWYYEVKFADDHCEAFMDKK